MTTGFDGVEAIVREEIDQMLNGGSDHFRNRNPSYGTVLSSAQPPHSKMAGIKILRPRGYRPNHTFTNAVSGEASANPNDGALSRGIKTEVNDHQPDVKDPLVFGRALSAADGTSKRMPAADFSTTATKSGEAVALKRVKMEIVEAQDE